MKLQLPAILLALVAFTVWSNCHAAIVDVRAAPRQATLVASGGNLVSIRWTVAATPGHSSGVISPNADIIDPSSGAILRRIATTLNGGGTAPFVLREVLNIEATTVRDWAAAGLRRVVLRRSFADPATGGFVNATVVLNLSGSRLRATREASSGELAITSLRLEFETGNNAVVIGQSAALQAVLTVQHTGTGILRGRWQIAEPGSFEGVPVFRTLALVNTNLRSAQRSIFLSPTLPTARPGTYALRFCATERSDAATRDDVLCPDADRTVDATYQVQESAGEPAAVIQSLAPDRAPVSETSVFRWQHLPSARLYQLQVFAFGLDPGEAGPDARAGQPHFVTGMLVGGPVAETRLSELAISKLQPGQRYLWRITALDEAGHVLGSSAEASFVFDPGTDAFESKEHNKNP